MEIPDIPDTFKMLLMLDRHNYWINWAREKFPEKMFWLPYAESLKRSEEISDLLEILPIIAIWYFKFEK